MTLYKITIGPLVKHREISHDPFLPSYKLNERGTVKIKAYAAISIYLKTDLTLPLINIDFHRA